MPPINYLSSNNNINYYNMDHQDWKTAYVYLDQKSKETTKEKNNQTKGPNKEQKMEEKIENGEKLKVKVTPIEMGREIQKKRTELNLTQKQLAQKVNVLPKVILEIESGKAKHNPQLIVKIKRILKI
tara:strand:- start:171 stop:551 length:381 start_codon:yes stop_codon:yes gene_type:complete